MQLITTLVEQLDGELELNRKNGTEFTIRFTVIEKNKEKKEKKEKNQEKKDQVSAQALKKSV